MCVFLGLDFPLFTTGDAKGDCVVSMCDLPAAVIMLVLDVNWEACFDVKMGRVI